MNRADSMALQNARLDQVFSKALSLFANGSVPAGGLRPAASRCRGTRAERPRTDHQEERLVEKHGVARAVALLRGPGRRAGTSVPL